MLQLKDVENDPTAIENFICRLLDLHRNELPLEHDNSKVLITLIFAKSKPSIIEDIITDINKQSGIIKILQLRQEHIFKNKIVDDAVFIMLALITNGNPGQALMYLYFIQWFSFENKIDSFGIDEFCEKAFPMGVFKEETLGNIWRNTKVRTDYGSINLLDIKDCAASFMVEEIIL